MRQSVKSRPPGRELPVAILDLGLEGVTDRNTREAFYNILEELRSQVQLNFFWKFFSKTFSVGGTYTFKHNLGFKPKDSQITGIINTSGQSAYIDLDTADKTDVDITVTGPCTVRFLLGNLDVNSTV